MNAPGDNPESTRVTLVTGATGVLGPLLVGRLRRMGAPVRVLTRQPPRAEASLIGTEVIVGDVNRPDDVAKAMAGVSRVFHLAGRLHAASLVRVPVEDYEETNVHGTAHVVEAASRSGAQVVFFSTISVYGPGSRARILTEDDPASPVGQYARTKLRAEEIVLTAATPGVVLRLGAVYGSRMKGNYVRLMRALKRGVFISLGDGLNRRTLVHQRDAVEAAIQVSSRPGVEGQIFNVTDGRVHTLNEIISSMCRALGRRTPRLRLARPVALAAATVGDALLMAAGRHPHLRGDVQRVVEDVAVSGDKICRQIGFSPQVELDEGWREALTGTLAVDK